MEILQDMRADDIVLVMRDDHNGDRIPMEYRMYITDKTYIYKAKIVNICINKSYNRVQPLPASADTRTARLFTRKAYKTKIYKLPMPYT
jgi:acyl-CoA thioesterase FadM